MNILIAVPSMDTVPAVFAQSLAMLEKVENCAVAFQVGSLVYDSRNKLGKKALEMEADYIFWLDSDMMFEPDILKRMYEEATENDYDILSGVYYRRRPPYTPVLFDKLEVVAGRAFTSEFQEIPDKTFEVGGIGFGCVLMKVQVLFDMMSKYNDMFSPVYSAGEDLSFCIRAKELGYKIYANPEYYLGHYSQTIVNRQFYEAFKRGKENA